ncbi:TPA: hypothetical protein ACH3X2_012254 [Trebouxia sp. C0005]
MLTPSRVHPDYGCSKVAVVVAQQKTDTMLKEEAAADTEDSRYEQAAANFVKNGDFPIELICPITQTLIYDPVLTVQGNVYERAAITEWLQTHTTDPLTDAHLTVLTLIPCKVIKSEIEAFKAEVRKLGPEAAARLPRPESPPPFIGTSAESKKGGTESEFARGSATWPQPTGPHASAGPVCFVPFSQPLTTHRQALSAVLHGYPDLEALQSIIGTYFQSKHRNNLIQISRSCCGLGEYAFSRPDIRLFNHVMHKLESLSASVISSEPDLRRTWVQAVNPFRRQLFNALYMSNHCVQAFAGGLPGGRLELPRMDDWTLGVWQDNSVINSAPVSGSRLDPSRPLLSQVHTVLLIDDSESMLERGSGGWGGNGQSGATRWDQVRELLCDLAPTITHYDPQGIDLHFLNHQNAQQGLQSAQQVHDIFSRVRPWGGTPLGLQINTILDGYMSSLRYERDLKPLNLVVITDGKAGDEGILFASLEEHVTRIVQRGHPAHQMGIEFLQVGDCRWATAHLYEIEEVVSQHHKSLNRDVVGVTPVGYMQQHRMNGATLMQVILSGIDARVNGYLRQRRINV